MWWNQCKFYLGQSWKSIKAKKIAYFTLYFANLLGLLLPLMLVYLYTATYSVHYQSQIKSGDKTAVIMLKGDTSPSLPQGIDIFSELGTYGVEFTYRTTTFSDTGFYVPKIVLVDENYSTFYNLPCAVGTFLSKEQITQGELVCVIAFDVRQELFGEENPIGQHILIGDKKYCVTGVLRDDTHFLKIIIPAASVDGLVNVWMPEKNILFQFEDNIDVAQAMTDISSILTEKQVRFFWEMADVRFQRNITGLAKGLSRDFLISLALCFLVMLNLGNIMFAVVDAERKTLGIKYALGISKKHIFIEKAISNCLITLLSLATLLAVLVVITYGFHFQTLAGDAYKILLLPAFGLVLLLSILEALLLMRKMFNDRIMNLLQE